MPAPTISDRTLRLWSPLLRGGLTLAVVDFLWAEVLGWAYGAAPLSAFRGVAAVVTAPTWMPELQPTLALGLLAHVAVAFTWAALYLLLQRNSRWLHTLSSTRRGQLAIAAVYGPLIWVVMSRVVIPTMTGRAAALSIRWAVQLAGHVFFVGLPVVLGVGRPPLSDATRR
ncbi:MAG: hypothetical protein KF709_07350 [Gemmatimonadaceae bacterium]|nr:hypothetical protein [Gemmatimonadaceae bacterium]